MKKTMVKKDKFKSGDIVYEITYPAYLMVILSVKNLICYCRKVDNKNGRQSAYMERELRIKSPEIEKLSLGKSA
jgi:hypothetical protein